MHKTLVALSLSVLIHSLCANQSSEKIFTEIYEHGGWGKDESGKGFSGYGSTLPNTKAYIEFLESFLKTNHIQSVLDVGCGDWTFSQYIQWEDIEYSGIDVVKEVIDEDIKRYSSDKIHFIYGDILQMDLPKADLVICKDVLMHLTTFDIEILLEKFKNFKHCLFTNNVDPKTLSSENPEILRGDFRDLDLTMPPFKIEGTKLLNYYTDHSVKQIIYVKNCE